MLLRPGVLRPSRVLGLLLFAVVGLFIGFVRWQLGVTDPQQRLVAAQWVVAVAAFTAVVGWLTNAIVTIRNSVKQHTINTLLQSRLSATYMEKAGKVNTALSNAAGENRAITTEQIASNASIISEVMYFLNYFEFVAVGIRHGDLDEDLMKRSVRGFVDALHSVSKEIIELHSAKNPRTLEHFRWLQARWADKSKRAGLEITFMLGAYATAVLLAATFTPRVLNALAGMSPVVPAAAAAAPAAGAAAPAAATASAGAPRSAASTPSSPVSGVTRVQR